MVDLRAVQPGEKAPRKKKLTVTQVAKTDNHRELLAALRDRIAGTIENPNCNPVALAALSRQLVLISKELTVLDTISGEDAVTVAAGQVNHDQLRIELVEPTNAPAFVAINWPTAATVVDPKRFPDTAAAIAQLFARAHIVLAALRAHRK